MNSLSAVRQDFQAYWSQLQIPHFASSSSTPLRCLDNIVSEKSVFLIGCLVKGDTVSSQSDITAKVCSFLGKAEARGKVTIEDTNFRTIESETGSVSCTASAPAFLEYLGESIQARDSVVLEHACLIGSVVAIQGNIRAADCRLRELSARKGVHLCETTFTSITSHGGPVVYNGYLEPTGYTGYTIHAKEKVIVSCIRLFGEIVSSHAGVKATKASTQQIRALKSIELKETTVQSTVCSQDTVELEDSKVLGTVFSSSRLTLIRSSIACAKISFPKEGNSIISVVFDEGSIEGDLIIIPKQVNQSEKFCTVQLLGTGTIAGSIQFEDCRGRVECISASVLGKN